jgi:signal transduction histidine kinase
VLQDVTRLREAEQLKDDFLSLVSHEFRTPLTAIHGGAHLLVKHGAALDEGTRAELLGDIVAESGRLDRMLANLLTLTAVMAGRVAASTEPVLLARWRGRRRRRWRRGRRATPSWSICRRGCRRSRAIRGCWRRSCTTCTRTRSRTRRPAARCGPPPAWRGRR